MQRSSTIMLRTSFVNIPSSTSLSLLNTLCKRTITGRPGQPVKLNQFDKGISVFPVPSEVKTQEAETMGKILPSIDGLQPLRPVPTSYQDFENQRIQYEKSMAALRQSFRSQYKEREQRETKAKEEHAMKLRSEKQARDAAKAAKKLVSQRTEYEKQQKEIELRLQHRAEGVAREELRLQKIQKLRNRWLLAIDTDAKARWITEEMIEQRINPTLFALKYAWQFERWFEVKERKRQLREEARRNRRPGQPLREILLTEKDVDFASDWESEGEEDVGVGSARHAAKMADAVANDISQTLGSHAQAEALTVARRIAREKGILFPEPAYDEDGRPLPAPNSSSIDAQEPASNDGDKDKVNVQLAELYHGKRIDEILKEYEDFMTNYAKELGITTTTSTTDMMVGDNNSTGSTTPVNTSPKESSSASLIDDGERIIENVYIDTCVKHSNVEALYYALLRKRDRLLRNIMVQKQNLHNQVPVGTEIALLRLAREWGSWIMAVGNAAGGNFDVQKDKNAQLFLEYMNRAGVQITPSPSEEENMNNNNSSSSKGTKGSTDDDSTLPPLSSSPDFDDRNLSVSPSNKSRIGEVTSSVPLPTASSTKTE